MKAATRDWNDQLRGKLLAARGGQQIGSPTPTRGRLRKVRLMLRGHDILPVQQLCVTLAAARGIPPPPIPPVPPEGYRAAEISVMCHPDDEVTLRNTVQMLNLLAMDRATLRKTAPGFSP